jgi:hypothetical protein
MGWQQFEQMVQALALRELGNGLRVFGSGKDGGREATFDGPVSFPKGTKATWDGFGVLQVKHREKLGTTTADWRWFLSQVEEELSKWFAKQSLRSNKEAIPKYFLFATNVTLSGTAVKGGVDQFESLMRSYRKKLGLKGWFAWDYSQLRGVIDSYPEIRQTYLEQIVTGDYLVKLESLLPRETTLTGRNLAIHAGAELSAKQWVRIGDSGFGANAKLRISDIGIDLPSTFESEDSKRKDVPVVRLVSELSDQVFRPSSPAETVQGVLIFGGPGQGKSTVAQLIAHNFRISFVEDAGRDVAAGITVDVLNRTRDRLRNQGVAAPSRRRWPVVVDMAQFASWLTSSSEPDSLLIFIANSIVVQGHPADPGAVVSWMASWPTCVILDGLDEVVNPKLRTRVNSAIAAFYAEMHSHDADIFTVATSRPQGYRDDLEGLLSLGTIRLQQFSPSQAMRYAEALIAVRSDDDPDQRRLVSSRLIHAVNRRMTQKLMTTPLQVTIMTALAERAADLPTNRHELFDAYYSTIYDREAGKTEEFRRLRSLRSHIDHLHERAGLDLQILAEAPSSRADLLSSRDLERILHRRLRAAGYDPADVRTRSADLLSLASDRLVMLVSPDGRMHGFEVRSVQEYMAARALTEGQDEDILNRLKLLLPSTHWRNTWLLAAGRLMDQREHLAESLIGLVVNHDGKSSDMAAAGVGSDLAADLLLDGIAADFPKYKSMLLSSSFLIFADTASSLSTKHTDLVHFATGDESEKSLSEQALDILENLSNKSTSNLATKLLSQYRKSPDPIGRRAKKIFRDGRAYEKPVDRGLADRMFIFAESLRSRTNVPQDDEPRTAISEYIELLEDHSSMGSHELMTGINSDVMIVNEIDQLDDPDTLAATLKARQDLFRVHPDVYHAITEIIRDWVASKPRGGNLP